MIMKKLLTTLIVIFLTATGYAQEVPNTLRYKLKDHTTVDIRLSELQEIKKIGNISMRNIFIDGAQESTEFLLDDIESIDFVYKEYAPDDNLNINLETYARRLEIPHLNAYGDKNLFIEHSTQTYGVTYALEWDCNKKSQRWTAYQFHNGIPNNNVGRTGNWKDDPDIPAAYRSHDDDYYNSGFSRGHMCMSNDRQSSEEQNKQTFYISNAHPQYQKHNGGLWQTLENVVNKWGNDASFRDTLYVVKAGTIDKDEDILAYTNSGKTSAHLPVPKYFYMAILCLKNGQYKAIGFWTEHTNVSITKAKAADYAISIHDLEEKTGIDFFCNLPDDIEAEVEAAYTLGDWGLNP